LFSIYNFSDYIGDMHMQGLMPAGGPLKIAFKITNFKN